jgi:hypothetical protein
VLLHQPHEPLANFRRILAGSSHGSILSTNGPSDNPGTVHRSRSVPARYYTGLTSHVAARLAAHNAGRCTHTSSARPWELVVVIEFADETRAIAFEKYLKSGSGVAFSTRHFR